MAAPAEQNDPGGSAGEGEAFAKTAPAPAERISSDLAKSILPSSGTMIGVCATLIGLIKLVEGLSGPTLADEIGSVIAVAFLTSAILSYLAMRTGPHRPVFARGCERVSDVVFMAGLISLVGLAVVFAFEVV